MHGLISATDTEKLVKGKNRSEFNIKNKTSKRAMLNPQEKTTFKIQPSINTRNGNDKRQN